MKKKLAFTIAELLISMIIIGIVTVVGINTFMRYDKGIRYIYANAYHNLDRALFNSMNFSDDQSGRNPFKDSYVNENGSTVNVSQEGGAAILCEMLSEYLSHSIKSCSPSNLASTNGVDFGEIKLQTLNGVNLYISRRLPDNPGADDTRFFIIYADINSDKKPNSMRYVAPSPANKNTTTDPDTFAFAALDTGRVCLLGIPEFNDRYVQARIAYEALEGQGNNSEIITKYTTASLPYYYAKAEAWGYYTGAFNDRTIIPDEPSSYNDYIRSKLPQNTEIYSFLNGQQMRVPNNVRLRSQPVEQGGYGCERHDAEKCWVIVDKYLY